MKSRFNNDIRKHFLHLNKMPFCLPAVYSLLGLLVCLFLCLEFSPPFSQISMDKADHLALFFPSRRVASTKLIVFMSVNRF